MRPLSESTSRIASKTFSRKYIALGRVVNQWEEIMGPEFAALAQPVKLNYRKNSKAKGKNKSHVTLDIATSAAHATLLNYQKGVILERINSLFGNNWIKDIRFVASELSEQPLEPKSIKAPLTAGNKKYLSGVLDQIEDPDIKEKLENLGKAILTDRKE
ncbi:MAG: DUF721 domain-containing protein [Alphaproteobacteria bacterium]|nr:DUF721 domain-containing protein [Alphaproteobacteria bacterium]